MGVSTPHLSPRQLLSRDTDERSVLDAFREADVRECRVLGRGKVGLAALLSRMDDDEAVDGSEVLLPALITDGLVGAVEAAGFDPTFYRVRPDLGADCADLRARLDEDTVAVVAVHYFGVEQPAIDEIAAAVEGHGCYLVVDGAHSPLSREGDQLLAATGDAAIASLHKQFPVPDGAVLTVSDPSLAVDDDTGLPASAVDPAGDSGRSGPLSADATAFCVESVARFLGSRVRRVRRSFTDPGIGDSTVRTDGQGETRPGESGDRDSPEAIYRSSTADPAGVTLRILERTAPGRVRTRRRRNYQYWVDSLAGSTSPEVLYPELASGVCPQVFPVLAKDPPALVDALRKRSTPADRWPPLPDRVRDDERFPTTNHIADRLVRLPVHQGLTYRDLTPAMAATQAYGTRPSADAY